MTKHCHDDPCDNFCPTQDMVCFFDHIKPYIQNMITQSLPDTSVIDALSHGIDNYECTENKVYNCKDIILYKGAFFESLKNNNTRHPHDHSAWKEHGTLKDIFSTLSSLQGISNISIQYHNSCNISNYCKPFYMTGDIVAVKVDSGQVDSCDNPIMVDVYYISTADNNSETPNPDAENWKGPMTVEQLLAGEALSGQVVCSAINELPNQCDGV